jgi:hypothetical protein
MPIQQATFKLVPETVAAQTVNRQRMTLKQAKKAHRQATALPKLSKAEQRRLEKEELDRQKREHERERANSKAKAARDKKALKLQAEKEERKRCGEPEPRRGVRPSQAVITGFVKVDRGKKRTFEDSESKDLTDAEFKRQESESPFKPNSISRDMIPHPQSQTQTEKPQAESPETPQPKTPQIDTPRLEIHHPDKSPPSAPLVKHLSQPFVLTKIESPFQSNPSPQVMLSNSELGLSQAIGDEWGDWPSLSQGDLPKILAMADDISRSSPKKVCEYPMNPPETITSPHQQNPAVISHIPPPSTMAVLEACIDEFEYTPTQETRNFLSGLDYISSNSQIAREITEEECPSKFDISPAHDTQTEDTLKFLSELDCIPSNTQILQEIMDDTANYDELSSMYSHDFEISSQDMRDIDPLGKAVKAPSSTVQLTLAAQPSTQTKRQARPKKPRFFEEKEEDLMKAAVEESLKIEGSSRRWKHRFNPKERSRSTRAKTKNPRHDEYGSEEFASDELLAVLEAVEREIY